MSTARARDAKRAEEVLTLASAKMDTDPRRACQLFLRAARLLSASADHSAVANALMSAALSARAAGSLNRALRILRRARKAASRSANSALLARALYETAITELALGSHRRARRFARAALKLDPNLSAEPFLNLSPSNLSPSPDPLTP